MRRFSLALALVPILLHFAIDGCGAESAGTVDAGLDVSVPQVDAAADAADATDATDAFVPDAVTPTDAADGGCLARIGCGPSTGTTIKRFSDRALFEAALDGLCPRTVGFDDVDAGGADPVAIASDRYASLGLVLAGSDAGGQYVHTNFGWPADFIAVSPPNLYAPGPQADKNAANGSGGSHTDVTFRNGASSACVAGFGAKYIDVEPSNGAKSSLAVFDQSGNPLDTFDAFTSPNGTNVFVGMIAVDGSGNPVPVISRALITNGGGYPRVAATEGVVLDDLVFDLPATP